VPGIQSRTWFDCKNSWAAMRTSINARPTQGSGDGGNLVKRYAPSPARMPLSRVSKKVRSWKKFPSEIELAHASVVAIDERDRTLTTSAVVRCGDPLVYQPRSMPRRTVSPDRFRRPRLGGKLERALVSELSRFPNQRISGRRSLRALRTGPKFGARMVIPTRVSGRDPTEKTLVALHVADGRR